MRHQLRLRIVGFVLLWLPSALLAAVPNDAPVVIHVSADAKEEGDGSEAKPLRNLHRVMDVVRAKAQVDPARESIVVQLRGTFFLDKTLALSEGKEAPFAGPSSKGPAIVFTGPATISGGQQLGPWRVEGNVWKIDIPTAKEAAWSFRDLYINNERRPRARTPNEGFFRVEKTGPDRRTSFHFKPGDLKSIAHPTAAEIVFLHDWSISRIPIKAIDESAAIIRFTHPIGNAAPHYAIDHFEQQPRYFLEGAAEYLDAPGEWHLDSHAGVLSYLPRAGEKPEDCVAIAPRLETLVALEKCSDITFEDVTFAHTNWALPPGGYAGSQASFHEDRTGDRHPPGRKMVPAAITVDDAQTIRFLKCRFEHLGGSGLYFHQRCFACLAGSCTFRDIGANGVMIGDPGLPRGFEKNADVKQYASTENVVRGCTIEHCGQLDYGAVGIWVGIAARNTIDHNTIRHLPYTGISVGWKWDPTWTPCFGNQVTNNHIHDVLQKMSDGGGIYTLGQQAGTKLSRNRIHDIPVNLGRAESNGIFMDEGSSQIVVEHNTIYNLSRSPIRFHKAQQNELVENTLVTPPGVPHFRYNNADEKTMTFFKNQLLEAEKWTPPGE